MKKILTTLVLLTALAIPAFAQVTQGYVSKAGANSPGATNSLAIFPAPWSGNRAIVLKSWQAKGDNADAVLQVLGGTRYTTLTSAQTTSSIAVASTNNWSDGDLAVIQDADGNTSWGWVASFTGSSIVLDRDPGDFPAGSRLYRMSNISSTTVGNATATRQGDLWGAQSRMPLVVRLYTSAGTTEVLKDATVQYYSVDKQ